MAVRLLSGKMLKADLLRDNINLSVEGDIIYVDVTNNRLGINTASPTVDFEVNGTSTLANVSHSTNTISSASLLNIETASNGDLTLTTNAGFILLDSTAALRLPNGTTAEQPADLSGLIRWNTDNVDIEFNDGTQWLSLSAAGPVPTSESFTPDGITAIFTLSKPATADTILVIINGLVQPPVSSYSVAGTTLTLTEVPLTTDIISVRFLTA